MRRIVPYVLTGLGLVGGLVVLLWSPLATARLNYFVGGALLLVAVASVVYMIVEFSGPGERGPDF
jgi:uncharacterized membrane protein HdeD (DUF308 family)